MGLAEISFLPVKQKEKKIFYNYLFIITLNCIELKIFWINEFHCVKCNYQNKIV